MQKQLLIITTIMLLFVVNVSCSDGKKEDLLDYINVQLSPLGPEEAEIITLYGSVTGDNYTDDQTTYEILLNDIIPKTNKLIDNIEKIRPSEPELRDIHDKLIFAWNTQQNAFVQLASALEKQDIAIIASANEKLTAARKELRDYQTALEDYAKKVNVPLQLSK
jgi:hypothetical protein